MAIRGRTLGFPKTRPLKKDADNPKFLEQYQSHHTQRHEYTNNKIVHILLLDQISLLNPLS